MDFTFLPRALSGPIWCDNAVRTISAIPPLLRAMGILVSQHGQLGARCDTPPPPRQKGYLSDTRAITFENKAKRVRYPLLRYYLQRVLYGGGISHWAAKPECLGHVMLALLRVSRLFFGTCICCLGPSWLAPMWRQGLIAVKHADMTFTDFPLY